MISEKNFSQRFSNRLIGPGGWKCNCCAPAPGPDRKKFLRSTKRGGEKSFWRTYIAESLTAAED